jgi:hypothetical protein
LRDRQQHISIGNAGLFQHRRVRCISHQRAKIEALLQERQLAAVRINHGDVIGFAHQALRHRRTDLPRTQYQYFQSIILIFRSRAARVSSLSTR